MTRPPPLPVSAPAAMSNGVVEGAVSSTHRAGRRRQPGEDQEDRADPVGQPAARDAGSRIAMPSATKNRPMSAPAASARCGRNATMTPQWQMYSRSMAMSRAHGRPEREPETPRRDLERPVAAGLVAAGREPQRHEAQDREADHHRPESERRHPVERRRGQDGQRDRRDDDEGQVVGAPHERETEPATGGLDEPRHERQRRRQDGRDADPLEDARDEERPRRAARLDAGKQQDHAADEVGQRARREPADAADPIDRPRPSRRPPGSGPAPRSRRSAPICGIRHAGPRQARPAATR